MKNVLHSYLFVSLLLALPSVLEPAGGTAPHAGNGAVVTTGAPVATRAASEGRALGTKPSIHRPAVAAPEPAQQAAYGKLPLQFEENLGQTDPQVKYLARGRGYKFFVTPQETVLAFGGVTQAAGREDLRGRPASGPAGSVTPQEERSETVLRFALEGANAKPRIEGAGRLAGISNYLIGNDPAKWRTNVPNYARVVEHGVYRGIDAAYYGKEGQLESDFIVAPGRDPGAIRMKITGAQSMAVNADGDLVLATPNGTVKLEKPVLYQLIKGAKRKVEGGYRLLGENQARFVTGPYDHRLALVIDPTLVYSTYLGGSGLSGDAAEAIAVDANGSAYVTGFTTSTDFPTAGAHQGALGGPFAVNAFVTKLAASGASPVFSTYLGGSGTDGGFGIAVDATGEPIITGATSSTDFPRTLGPGLNGGLDAFVSKLSANGSALVYSFYLGGESSDQGSAIAVDAAGNAYVTGSTSSTGFPVTTGVFQRTLMGSENAFVAKIAPAGGVLWATYLGGNLADMGSGIGVDGANPANVYVSGSTSSTTFPTHAPIQANLGGAGATNAFVSELNPTGTALVYSTYLGGSSDDEALGIAVDSGGNAVVAGLSNSQDFPLVAPLESHSSNQDLFVAKVAAGGGSFVFSTVFGDSSGQTQASAVAIDPSGNIYVAGNTSAYLLPTLDPLQGSSMLQCECGGGESTQAGVVMEFKPDGSDYLFSTFFGGAANNNNFGFQEAASGLVADPQGDVYIAGKAASMDFPTVSPFQAALNSPASTNGFVAKISPATPAGPQFFPSVLHLQTDSVGGTTFPFDVTLLNGTNTLTISSLTFTGPNAADFSEVDSCLPELLPHAVCTIEVRGVPTISTTETATLNITDSDTSSPQLVALTLNVVAP
ncbi:MAG TPA: SBBP repeat-containing protein, partial [Candidatus Acidoferrales bacterium]|nr:SBBP repeat-containing protein [Candidatus Acidoferrales bacterium]